MVACCLLGEIAACAGVVQGVVLEQASGRPMARTQVRLVPVPKGGKPATPFAMRSGLSGQFSFLSVPEGLYILTATRSHYFPASYGQRLPGGAGTPLDVKEVSTVYVELHLRRMGAISGRILDENGIGMSEIPVVAYRTRLPLRIAGTAISDDRGVYRIHDLFPGKYWIRSGQHTLEDGAGMLPTFSPEARESRDARAYAVAVDSETTDADVRPNPGALFHLGGIIQCEPPGHPVMVRLASETGSRTTGTGCGLPYSFEGLAPGGYEVFAETQGGASSGFIELFLDHDSEAGGMHATVAPQIDIRFMRAGGGYSPNMTATLIGRRVDLADAGPEIEIKAQQSIPPGHWEMGARVGPGEYVESIRSGSGGSRRQWRAEQTSEWFDVFIESRFQTLFVTIADSAGHIKGTVTAEKAAVAGIPVFLWPVAEAARRSLRGPQQMLSDVNGEFHFDGLPPGDYRLVASYDLTEVDEESVELAKALVVHVDKSQTASAELGPWLAPY